MLLAGGGMRTVMKVNRSVSVAAAFLCLAVVGCGISRQDAQDVGKAGQNAAQAIDDQANSVIRYLSILPGVAEVREDLLGLKVNSGGDIPANVIQDIIVLVQKREAATKSLLNAYTKFYDLSKYDAGQETQRAISDAFSSINGAVKAANAFPQGQAIQLIADTTVTIVSNIGGVIGAEIQKVQLSQAAGPLTTATGKLIEVLEAESLIMVSMLKNIQSQKAALVGAGTVAGLYNPADILSSFMTVAAPGYPLSKNPPNSPAIKRAALAVIRFETERQRAAAEGAYVASINALKAVKSQLESLQNRQSVDMADVQEQIGRIQAALAVFSKGSLEAQTGAKVLKVLGELASVLSQQ